MQKGRIMAARKGLGRGIGALIPGFADDTKDEEKKITINEEIKTENEETSGSEAVLGEGTGGGEMLVKISQIEPNKNQPRKEFDIELLKELADSIQEVGILQPIIVRKKDDKYYEIIAGERRWRAAKLAKLKEVPVIVRDFTPEEVMEAALIENIQRQDLNPIEEAKAFENLINEYKMTQEDVAKKVSKSRAQISNLIRLLKLDDKIQALVVSGELSTGHARALLALGDPDDIQEVAKTIIDNDLSVRETEKLIQKMVEKPEHSKVQRAPNPAMELVYREMEKKLEKSIGSRVNIKSRDGKKGKIQIDYYSQEELERLIDKLGQ